MPIVALVADLIFASRITAIAALLALPVQVVRRPEEVLSAVGDGASVLLDLTVAESSMPDLIRALKRGSPQRRIVGYFPHIRPDLARQARAAGADEVLPRSAFTRRIPELLTELARSETAPPASPAADVPTSDSPGR